MITYLKNANPDGIYVDPKTRMVIEKGKIAAVEVLTETMKKRMRKKGLIVCTKEEYEAQSGISSSPDEPAPPSVSDEPSAPEATPEEVEPAPVDSPQEAKEEKPDPKPGLKMGKGKKKK